MLAAMVKMCQIFSRVSGYLANMVRMQLLDKRIENVPVVSCREAYD